MILTEKLIYSHLNLGSGQRRFERPWVNVDVSGKHSPDIMAEGREYLKDYPASSVEMICLHHVLEHFGCNEADDLLRECARVLRPRGSLLVFVPDMTALAQRWLSGGLTDQIYFTNVYGAYLGEEGDRHRWGFTARSLREKLAGCGLRPCAFDWRLIPGADIARDFWILGMEGIK